MRSAHCSAAFPLHTLTGSLVAGVRVQKLGFKVRPVLAMTHDAFGRYELQHAKEVMRLQKQVMGSHEGGGRRGMAGPAGCIHLTDKLLLPCLRARMCWECNGVSVPKPPVPQYATSDVPAA